MIKTIIFDLGNVLVYFDEMPIFRKWAAAGNKKISQVMDYYKKSRPRRDFEKGKISPKQFYDKTVQDLGLKMTINDFRKNWNEIFTLNKGAERIVKSLKGKYNLILLSNTNIWQYEYVKKKYKVVDLFDEHILSYEVGMRKPNPMIYLIALRKSKTLPFNCAYFDDIPQFIKVAGIIGIKAFQYKEIEKLRNDLNKLKILWEISWQNLSGILY